MSKIVQAINAMILRPDRITEVFRGAHSKTEYFFIFMGKYKWSVDQDAPGLTIYYYPGTESTKQLAELDGEKWNHISMVSYTAKNLNSREATESMKELHTLLTERVYGLSEVLDDIIGSDYNG